MRIMPIPEWPDYGASEDGNIYRLTPTRTRKNVPFKIDSRVRRRRYLTVLLARNGKSKCLYVHTLVLMAFVGPRPDGHEACHYDGNKLNNAISNLRWDTHLNNVADQRRLGLSTGGTPTKISDADVELIRSRGPQRGRHGEIARLFGVSRQTISKILAGKKRVARSA